MRLPEASPGRRPAPRTRSGPGRFLDGSSPLRSLPLALGLLLVARAALVLTLADVFFVGEELAHGAAAKAILDGLPVALPRLSYQYYEGGGLIASALTAPVFALIGPCHLGNKLIAFAFDAANLAAGFWLSWRCFGSRAAWAFALLYVFAPAACQQIALLNVGNHHAAIVFFFLLPLLALPILRSPAGTEPSARRYLALGAVAGFGIAFNLMVAPLVAFLALALAVLRPRLLRARTLACLAAGFALGSLPLLWTLLVAGSEVFNVHGIDLLDPFGTPPTSVAPDGMLAQILKETGPLAELSMLGLLALPIVGALGWLRARAVGGRSDALFAHLLLLAFVTVFTLASVFSRFHPTYFHHWSAAFRYLPHWGLATLLAASAIGYLLAHAARPVRVAGTAALVLLAGSGLLSTWSLAAAGQARDAAHVREVLLYGHGFDYNEYFPKLVPHLPGTNAAKLGVLLHFDDDPRLLYPEIAWGVYPSFDGQPSRAIEELRAAGGDQWELFLGGLGKALVARAGGDLAAAVRGVAEMPAPLREGLYEGLGRYGRGGQTSASMLQAEIDLLREAGAPPAVFRGFAQRVHAGFRLDPQGAREFVSTQDPAVAGELARGLDLAQTLARVPGRKRSPRAGNRGFQKIV